MTGRRRFLGVLAGCATISLGRDALAQAFAEGPEAAAWFERASRLAGFATGTGVQPGAVVFFDARCPHCLGFWAQARRRGDTPRMHWVPVVLLSPQSARQAAALLRAADPVAAMDEHAAARADGGEGIAAQSEPDAAETRALKENTAMLRAMDVASVPAILHRDRAGRVGLTVGAMPVAELARLVEDAGSGPRRR
jgi:protein-disulfide isomerase